MSRAHAIDVGVAVLERNRLRECGANPQISLLQLGQEFQPQGAHREERQHREQRQAREGDDAIRQHELERRLVNPAQPRTTSVSRSSTFPGNNSRLKAGAMVKVAIRPPAMA